MATVLLAMPAAQAVEETGQLIEKLVAEVDQQLTSLEKLTDKTAGEKERAKSALDQQFAKYDDATGDKEKAGLRSEIVNSMAKLNATDRKEVGGTIDAVVKVSETMRKIGAAVQANPNYSPDSLKSQKEKLSKFVGNAAKMVKLLDGQAASNATTQNRTAALKNSLVMLHRQLTDPYTGTASAMERIQQTVSTLEGVAVQLHILQGMLENERTMLLTATHVQTVDLALMRLARARLGSDVVANIPMRAQGDVVDRIRRSGKPLMESGGSLLGGAAADNETFEAIATGEFEAIN
jgi:hypothetical protein